MTDLPLCTIDGEPTTVSASELDRLRQTLHGEMLAPGDPGYDESRGIWNGMIDRRPGLILRCRTAADVQRAVGFTAEHDLLASFRGGGHNIAGHAVCDRGVMVDLSPMDEVWIDPSKRKAEVGPGATLADLDRESLAHGLAVPVGVNSTTGVAGLTLGGGFGWLSRKHGMTVDSLSAVEVVTADAGRVRADADRDPDLFWALRGGGGNFGAVTRFEFDLKPQNPDVYTGIIAYPLSEAKSVLKQYRELVAGLPEETCAWLMLRPAPPMPFLPAEAHGKPMLALAVFHPDDPAEGEKRVEPFRRLGKTLGERLGVQPYTDWQSVFDPLLAPGARNYWKSHNMSALPDGLIDVIVDFAERFPSPHCEILMAHLGGAMARVPADATAYAHRDTEFLFNLHGRWETPAEDDAGRNWTRSLFAAAAPHSSGSVYVNFMTEEETDRVRSAFGPNYDRLARAKRKYDPRNRFRLNQNIRPAAD